MSNLFGATSTADEVLDGMNLVGRRFVVTGISSGLGAETARSLVAHGATVIGTARDPQKAYEATSRIPTGQASGEEFRIAQLDLASLDSIREFADLLLSEGKPLDAIIANAGVMGCPQGKTAEGFETQFGTNHIGHFVLVNRLAPLLKAGSRVIVVSSAVHGMFDIDLEDPNFERTPYHEIMGYGRSKTANVLFAVEFDRRFRNQGIRAAAVHPGAIRTNLTRHMTPEVVQRLSAGRPAEPREPEPEIIWKTIPQGAATSVWAACFAPAEAIGGQYCADCAVSGIADKPSMVVNGVQAYAVDEARAAALWDLSERLVQPFMGG